MTAAEKILKKALVGSSLNSREWNLVQAGLRDRAFISSQVESMRILHAARKMVADRAGGQLSASEIRRDLRKVISSTGYRPPEGKEGTLQDLYSKRRLDTIIKTNVEQARGYVRHLDGMKPGAFAAFPGQELIRVRERKEKRDWATRWKNAGGQFYNGRMIALRDDPIWERISVFGNPFPPFDWGSGMGVRAVSRRDSIALGVVTDNEVRDKVQELKAEKPVSMNENLAVSVTPEEESELRQAFGDQIAIENGEARWRDGLVSGLNPDETVRLPGGIELRGAALEGVPEDVMSLIPALLRTEGKTLEAFSGALLSAVMDGFTVKEITVR